MRDRSATLAAIPLFLRILREEETGFLAALEIVFFGLAVGSGRGSSAPSSCGGGSKNFLLAKTYAWEIFLRGQ